MSALRTEDAPVHLVSMLLPLRGNDGEVFSAALFEMVRTELVERFGGLTAYARSPAEGSWLADPGSLVRDEIIVYEVIVDRVDHAWWTAYRQALETCFRQDRIVIRAHLIEML